MPHRNRFRIVLEIEEITIVKADFSIDLDRLEMIAQLSSQLLNSGRQILIVSAGAIVAGVEKLQLKHYPETLIEKQAVSAVGQVELIKKYQSIFSEYNQTIAQVLLARNIVEEPERRRNASNTFYSLQAKNIIPIINENDTTSTADIEEENNYELTANVADIIEADVVVQLCEDLSFDVISPCKQKLYNVKTKDQLYVLLSYLERKQNESDRMIQYPKNLEELSALPRKEF